MKSAWCATISYQNGKCERTLLEEVELQLGELAVTAAEPSVEEASVSAHSTAAASRLSRIFSLPELVVHDFRRWDLQGLSFPICKRGD